MRFILNGLRQSPMISKHLFTSFERTVMLRYACVNKHSSSSLSFSSHKKFAVFTNTNVDLTLSHECITRPYSTQTVPKTDSKQTKNGTTGFKIFKYVSGFLGACILSAVGVREYWKRKYRVKGLEPVKEFRFGWKNTSYYYGGYKVPDFVVDCIDDIQAFEIREDDIWIIGFPKSGTTWLQEIVYLVANDANLDSAKATIEKRIPFFEYSTSRIKTIEEKPSPRFMKSHLAFSILPSDYHTKKPKTFYIARNPKDVLVSLYFFLYKFFVKQSLDVSFEEFCQLFAEGCVGYGPWWKHVKEGWERRNDDNVLFITYEDMKMDFTGSIKKIAAHLGKNLSDKDIAAIANHCSFEQMKHNNFVNLQSFKDQGVANKDAHFMRKGKVGDWRNHLSQDVINKLDKIVKTELEPLGITFKDPSAPKSDSK